MSSIKLALVLAGFHAVASAAPSLYITTEHTVQGTRDAAESVLSQRVRQIASRAGISYAMQQYPWKRAYAMALSRPNGCVFATTRTPEREALFKWIGPIEESEWYLAGRAGRDFQIKTLEDARAYRIGTYSGDARHEYLRARGFTLDPAQSDSANLPKLLLGRIDLWAMAMPKGTAPGSADYPPDSVVPVLKFNSVRLYLACNRAVPDSVVERMNSAAEAVEREAGDRAPPPERRTRRPPCLLPAETSVRNCD